MPPLPRWYAGRGAIGTFLGLVWKMYGGFRLVPIAANRQPAFAAYSRTGADGPWAAHSIHVLALEQDKISALTLFPKPAGPPLFRAFGLPLFCRTAVVPNSWRRAALLPRAPSRRHPPRRRAMKATATSSPPRRRGERDGTKSSNPVSSSGESINLRFLSLPSRGP